MAIDPNIKQIKIHPAIGLARVSTNTNHFVFDPQNPVRPKYKSGTTIMRQAVQFRLFAYGDANAGLYELTPAKLASMGLKAIWSIDLANGKIEMQTQNPSDRFAVRGDTSAGDLLLVGNLSTFVEGTSIPMGELSPDGLFVPPIAGIFRRTAATPVQEGMYDRDITDNTSDGSISVRIVDEVGQPASISVLPAWLSVGPPDFAPSWDDSNNPLSRHNLLTHLQGLLHTPNISPINPINLQAREIDRGTMATGTAIFGPGIEISDRQISPSSFYPVSVTADPDEIRLMPIRPTGGVAPGSMTDSLCSPWQYDFRACTCSWWPNHRPDSAFKDGGAGSNSLWKRKIAAASGFPTPVPAGELVTNRDFITHVYELGIVKKDPADPTRRVETERSNDI